MASEYAPTAAEAAHFPSHPPPRARAHDAAAAAIAASAANDDGDNVGTGGTAGENGVAAMVQHDEDVDGKDLSLKELLYSASSYHVIVKPVSVTMIFAALATVYINTPDTMEEYSQGLAQAYQVFSLNPSEDSTGETLGKSLSNALVIVSVIGGMTFVIVLLYKYRCMKCLIGYMVFSSASLLGLLGGLIFNVAINKYRLPVSVPSFYLLLWNFAVVGVIAIFYQKGIPQYVNQSYLIATSVILAWQLSHFDEWTAWTLLSMLALYDLCAVLTPCGPLKLLVNLMQQDDSPDMPGLLYEAELPEEARRPARMLSRGGADRGGNGGDGNGNTNGSDTSNGRRRGRETRDRTGTRSRDSGGVVAGEARRGDGGGAADASANEPLAVARPEGAFENEAARNGDEGNSGDNHDDDNDDEEEATPSTPLTQRRTSAESGRLASVSSLSTKRRNGINCVELLPPPPSVDTLSGVCRGVGGGTEAAVAAGEGGVTRPARSTPASSTLPASSVLAAVGGESTPVVDADGAAMAMSASLTSAAEAVAGEAAVGPSLSSSLLPRPTGILPLAIAKIYRLPLANPTSVPSRRDSMLPLLQDGDDGGGADVAPPETPNAALARQYSPEELRADVEVFFPRGGGRIVVRPGRDGQNRYDVLDRNGSRRRILVLDESGRVFEEFEQEGGRRRDWDEGEEHEEGANSIKLGLGDFIFYSVLVGKAALYSFTTFAACMLVILAGLGGTLVLLAVWKQALPALPISIFLGVVFYLLTRIVIEPWIEDVLRAPLYV